VPVRVTVLRSGTAYSIPGRSLDLGEGGIAVIMAGEVHPADSVGVEFLLPDLGLGVQAKAVVRHYAPMRCGFEFQGLTRHQQAVIREWTRQILQGKSAGQASAGADASDALTRPAVAAKTSPFTHRYRKLLRVFGAVVVLAVLIMWWRWQRDWKELEERIPQPTGQLTSPGAMYSSLPAHLTAFFS
jgi:hypothetical protein